MLDAPQIGHLAYVKVATWPMDCTSRSLYNQKRAVKTVEVGSK